MPIITSKKGAREVIESNSQFFANSSASKRFHRALTNHASKMEVSRQSDSISVGRFL